MIFISHNKRRGFTLIELVIVILILAIMAATASSRFVKIESNARKSTLDGLEAAIHSAMLLARVKYRLEPSEEIDMDGVMVAVTSKGRPCASATGIGLALSTRKGYTLGSDPANSCNGNRSITFRPNGTDTSSCQLTYNENGTISINSNGC